MRRLIVAGDKPLHGLAEQGFERLVEIVGRYALEIQPRQHRFQPPGLFKIRRQQARTETPTLAGPIPGLRKLHRNRPDAGEHVTCRLIAVAYNLTASRDIGLGVSRQKRVQLGGYGLLDHALRTSAYEIGELVGKRWISEGNRRIVTHGGGTSPI